MASVSHNRQESEPYLDAEVTARQCSSDELLAAMEVAALDAEDPHPTWPGDTGRWVASERLRAFETELERRIKIISVPSSRAAKYGQDREQWAALARVVRETISVPEVLQLIGCRVTPKGAAGRAGEHEFASDCPVCRAGIDRLISWDGPKSRCWCRQCGWRADVIAVARSFLSGAEGFRDAVRMLSSLASMNNEAQR